MKMRKRSPLAWIFGAIECLLVGAGFYSFNSGSRVFAYISTALAVGLAIAAFVILCRKAASNTPISNDDPMA